MLLNYKYEIFPNNQQKETLENWISICRHTYNSALLDKSNAYKNEKRNLKRTDMQAIQTADKKRFPVLKTVPSQPLQEVFFRLEKAFQKFFRKEGKYPKIKKYNDYTSITFTQFGIGHQNQKNKKTGEVKRIEVLRAASLDEEGKLLLSKAGSIPVNWHRPLDGKVKRVVIKRQGQRWFAIFCVDRHVNPALVCDANAITGIDVGIRKFAVLSDGTAIDNPAFLRKEEKKLKRAQRKLSRRKKGSSNWKKQLAKVQAIHTKVANQRKDFLHKQSYHLANTYGVICVENLNIRNMVKNRHVAKFIHDAGWGMFRSFLTYKCEKNGGRLIKVKPNFTSQDCSNCGNRVKKSLSVRSHVCKKCGTILDRDHNAALNIEKAGLDQIGLHSAS